jgi:amino acid transporter
MTVLQTGSIAILAYVFADYAAPLLGLSDRAAPALAGAAVASLTTVNLIGLRAGRLIQYLFTAIEVVGLAAVIGAILLVDRHAAAAASPPAHANPGLAMVFVLLTFGGWSEAAYLSAEMRDRRAIGRALVVGIGIITVLYLLANVAYLAALGRAGVADSPMVAASLMTQVTGRWGSLLVSAIVIISTLSSANAAMITGARSNFAVGRDVRWLAFLASWTPRGTPTNALILQGAVALVLVGFGAIARSGFEAMVAYTAPVFWLMLLLCGVALFVLRRRHPDLARPFAVPGYPITPALFCAASAFMLYASVAHAGAGALLGLGVMAAAVPVFLLGRR